MSEQSLEELRKPVDEDESPGIFGRTWELELLISGGVVFALLQLPPLLERGFVRLEPHVAEWSREAFFLAFTYLKGILYTLIGAFILHLTSRAYWIGLLGLEKVYPEGVRWDNLKSGPITRRVQRELTPSLGHLIVRVDLFCSSIFSFAFLVVIACLMSIVWIGAFGLLALGLSRLLGGPPRIFNIFLTIVFGTTLALALPAILDKLLAGRLEPGGRMARTLDRFLRVSYRLQLGKLFGAIALVLFSNSRRRSFYTVFWAILFGMMLWFTLSHVLRREGLWISGPPAAEQEILSLYYQDQWPEEGTLRLAPSIQSDVIDEPYIKLFIPYLPRRHDRAFAASCPNPQAKLDCAARIHRVALDGRVIPGLTFLFYTHPKSDSRGFLAYIPTAGLAAGPHLLKIEPLPARKSWQNPQPFFIRFWI
jgi:hypothetical protein